MEVSRSSTTSATTGKLDRFAYGQLVAWLLFSLLVYFSDQLDRNYRLSLLLVPLLVIPGLLSVIVWMLAVALSIWRKHWRYLGTVMLSLLLVVGTVLLMKSGYDSDWLRFQLFGWRYELAVRNLHQTGAGYRTWDWGDTGGVPAPNIFHKLVYNESDRIASSAFSNDRHSVDVRSLGKHFFLVTETYQ